MTGATWKWISGYEGLYEVSDRGEVCSYHAGFAHVLRPGRQTSGHLVVGLSRGGVRQYRTIHRLVLEAFVGPRPNGQEVRHLNGVPADNRWPENIEYATKTRNIQDRKWHRVREDHCSKLDPAQVTEIRRRAKTETIRSLAQEFGVSGGAIFKIKHGLSHMDVAV